MRFSEFTKLEPSRLGHIVVFVCADDLLVDESREVFQRLFRAESGGEWAFERLTVKEFEAIDGPDLMEAALGPPLFGPSRALLVSDGGKVTKKKMALVDEIASLEHSSLKIVFVTASKRGVPKAKTKLPTIEIEPVRPGDAARWLRQRYKVGPEVAQYLVETLGSELRLLALEMDKLSAYVRESRPVEIHDVDLLTLRSEQFSPFDLDDAVIERDYTKAVRVADAMVEEGMEPLIILSRVARVWRQLFVGKALAGHRSARDVAAAASVPHWKAAAFRSGCERHPMAALVRGFRELVAADKRFKSASTDRILLLDLLLWKLLRADRPA